MVYIYIGNILHDILILNQKYKLLHQAQWRII